MHEITLLSEWFIANKLSLSINKSCYTVFGASSEEKLHIKLYLVLCLLFFFTDVKRWSFLKVRVSL